MRSRAYSPALSAGGLVCFFLLLGPGIGHTAPDGLPGQTTETPSGGEAAAPEPQLGSSEKPTLTLSKALELALGRNASVLSLQSEVEAARARLGGASLILQANPELEGAVGPRFAADGTSVDYSVALSQRIELFGQRGARIDSAQALLGAAEARLASRRIELASEVREAYARLLAARQRERIAAGALELAEQALAAAQARQSAGAASQIEVNAARATLGRAARESATPMQRSTEARATLVLRLGVDPAEPVEVQGDLEGADARAEVDVPALFQKALAQRPDLHAAKLEVAAAEADRRLSESEWLPSPRLGVSYSEEGDSVGPARIAQGFLALDLPVFNRNQAGRGVAAARVTQAQRALEALTRTVRAEVELAARRLQSARAAAKAYAGGLLAGVEENMQLVNEAYRSGKVDFFELLVIRRETLEARNGYVDALEELEAAKAGLARALGSME